MKKLLVNRLKIFYTFTFCITFLIAFLGLLYSYNLSKNAYLDEVKKDVSLSYQSIYNKYKDIANIYFNTQVNKKDVIKILKQIPKNKNKARELLYKKLLPSYNNLKKHNIKQLHFHLTNNESFLRFHRPNIYGDDLTHIRDTVNYVNKNKTYIDSFEEGRIYNGYRYVYPLFDGDQKYLGSVEVSFNTIAFYLELKKNFSRDSNCFLYKENSDKKLFKDEKENYLESPLKDFYMEKEHLDQIENSLTYTTHAIKQLPFEDRIKINNTILLGKTDSFYNKKLNSIITIIPIKNSITNKIVAAFITFDDPIHLLNLEFLFYKNIFITLLFITLGTFILYFYHSSKIKPSQNNTQTPISNSTNKSKKRSLITIISIVLSLGILIVIVAKLSYDYSKQKEIAYQDLQQKNTHIMQQLSQILPQFIESYSITEYENILSNIMDRSTVAIIIDDRVSGTVLNQPYITGKMRDINWNIIDYEQTKENQKTLEDSFNKIQSNLYMENGDIMCNISIYSSDKFILQKLQDYYVKNIYELLLLYIILLTLLFVVLKKFLLSPIEIINDTLQDVDQEGIPLHDIQTVDSKELDILNNTINAMIKTIKLHREQLNNMAKDLQKEKTKYQYFLDSASDGIHIIDKKGNLVEYSQSFIDLLGYNNDEAYTLNVKDWDSVLNEDEIEVIIANLIESPRIFDTKHKRKDGTLLDIQINAKGISFGGKKYLYASARDITLQKNIENLLQTQKEEFETIFNNVRDGIAIIDLDTNFLNCNKAFLDITGFSKKEILTKSCYELTSPQDQEKNKEAIDAVKLHNSSYTTIEKSCHVKNKVISVNMGVSMLPDKKRMLLVIQDTTVLKLMQDQAKMASMGEMIGNIAHQWRQPLSVISVGATSALLKKEMGQLSDASFEKEMNAINDSAQYLSQTIDDFRNFLKTDRETITFNISDTIEQFLHLIEGSIINNNIHIKKNIDPNLKFNGVQNELIQCFINIYNNAKDTLKDLEDDDRLFFINAKQTNNSIEIRFTDNGGGIPHNVLPKIFEPYFTTKHQSKGTGLGLSMTYNLITDGMNGTILASNKTYDYNGKKYTGAEFLISLDQSE